jgi:MFS family permease
MNILSALSISRKPALAFVIIGLFWGYYAAHVPVFKAVLGVNDAIFGVILLGSATGLVTAMFAAPLVDRYFGARGMQIGAALFVGAWVFPNFATTPWAFALSMGIVGLASGILDVVMNARVSELEAQTRRSLMNANHAMFSVAYALGAGIASITRAADLPPIYAFVVLGALVLISLPYLCMPVVQVDAPADAAQRYPLWPICICGGIVLIAFMSEAAVETWSALHIERTLMGNAVEGALGPAMLGLTMAVGRFSGQVVSDRLREVQVVYWAAGISATGAVIASFAPSPIFAYIGFGILGLGVSVIGPMGLALVGKVVAPHLRTEAISKAAVIGFSGFFFAPVLIGLTSQAFGLRIAFLCIAGLLLLAIPFARLAARLPIQQGEN